MGFGAGEGPARAEGMAGCHMAARLRQSDRAPCLRESPAQGELSRTFESTRSCDAPSLVVSCTGFLSDGLCPAGPRRGLRNPWRISGLISAALHARSFCCAHPKLRVPSCRRGLRD
eukprot:823592-Pyramimonas_sp.AAC.1